MWIIPLIATLISASLSVSLILQYVNKKKIHHLLYAISFILFTLATFSEFYADVIAFNEYIYKIYYYSAITLVPVMAAGTAYLLNRTKRWIPGIFLAYVIILSAWLLALIIPAQPVIDLTGQNIFIAGEGMPGNIRGFSFPLSGVGGIILILGSIYSYWKTKYKGNLYIAAGAIVMASAGRLATMGLANFLSLSELIGVVLLYYGVRIHPGSKKIINPSSNIGEEKEA